MYLIRKKKAKTAHLWTGYDTACRMHSTGGLNKRKYEVVAQSDLPVCTMCDNKRRAINPEKKVSAWQAAKDARLIKTATAETEKNRLARQNKEWHK